MYCDSGVLYEKILFFLISYDLKWKELAMIMCKK